MDADRPSVLSECIKKVVSIVPSPSGSRSTPAEKKVKAKG
jgi:hypothetical protein